MARRVIIAGGREFDQPLMVESAMAALFADEGSGGELCYDDITVVSGGARGADKLGEDWAVKHGRPIETHEANWKILGKSAGYQRNAEMAITSDALVAFWDGESLETKHMIDIAVREGLEVHVYRY